MPPTLGATSGAARPPRHGCGRHTRLRPVQRQGGVDASGSADAQEKSPDSGSLMSGLGSSSTLTSLNVTTRTFLTKRAGR